MDAVDTTARDPSAEVRDDEAAEDTDRTLNRFLKSQAAERDAILLANLREVTREVVRVEALVSNSAQASADFARDNRIRAERHERQIDGLRQTQESLLRAVGDLSEGQGRIARDLSTLTASLAAERAERTRQDSHHETEITATRAAVTQTAEAVQQTAAEVRAVRLKAAGIRAGIGAAVITAWELGKHFLPHLLPLPASSPLTHHIPDTDWRCVVDASDLEFLLALARAYPRASAVVAACFVFAGLVLALASVRPSEAWALAHPRAFFLIRLARAVAPYLSKALDLVREARADGTLASAQALFAKGRTPTPAPPAAAPDPAPPAPPADGGAP